MRENVSGPRVGRHTGCCKTCGESFASNRPGKLYCCIQCYLSSPDTLRRLRETNAAKRMERPACLECGVATAKPSRRFCNKSCYRKFFEKRFDRFIASPETLALPQNFDEFLNSAVLPCIVEGCDWTGDRLSMHVNMVHGITAEKLKELAGFNRTTGLVSAPESERRRAIATQLVKDGKTGTAFREYLDKCRAGETQPPKATPSNRLEAKEHHAKAKAIQKGVLVAKICELCGVEFQTTSLGLSRRFCSLTCRRTAEKDRNKAFGDLRCSYCGERFVGNRNKVQRSERGLLVTCSDDCRNRMNIRTCLSKRGIVLG